MALAHADEAQVTFTRAVRGFDLFKIGKTAFENDEGFIKAFSPDIPASRFILSHALPTPGEFVIVTDPDGSVYGLDFDQAYITVVIKKVRFEPGQAFVSKVDYDDRARQKVLDVAFRFNEMATDYLK
jgi:hypothetical protein